MKKEVDKTDIVKAWHSYKQYNIVATTTIDSSGSQSTEMTNYHNYEHLKRNGHPPILQAMLDHLFPEMK